MVSLSIKDAFSRTVFLLGAGASIDAGCKSSAGMLSSLKVEIQALPVDDKRKDFLAIYDFIMQSLIYQKALKDPDRKVSEITNVEDFVAVLRQMIDREYVVPAPLVGNWNNKITSWEIKNENIFKDFLDFIYERLISSWIKFDSEKAKELVAPIRELLLSSESFDLSIFSLNYDLVFESSFNSENESLVYNGFSRNKWEGDFLDPNIPSKLKLYKLHGSQNWYFDIDEEEVKIASLDENLTKPLIVFGSGPKIQSYDPFLTLLADFRKKLKDATLYVVIGYSFQDKYINNILIQSLNSGLNRKMVVVDPAEVLDSLKFVQKIERFQASRSLNEVVSLTRISPERVQIEKVTAKQFFSDYLSNNAQKLVSLFNEVDQGDEIF